MKVEIPMDILHKEAVLGVKIQLGYYKGDNNPLAVVLIDDEISRADFEEMLRRMEEHGWVFDSVRFDDEDGLHVVFIRGGEE